MSTIRHHISDELLAAYAMGRLPYAYSLVVATHVSMCDQCRSVVEAHEAAGGAALDRGGQTAVSGALKAQLMEALDVPFDTPAPTRQSGVYPAPLVDAMGGTAAPKWRPVGLGVKQALLHKSGTSSVRLLHIPPGQEMPDHSHNGIEMTLVLQGSFMDEDDYFGVGDVEIADDDVQHTPVAGPDEVCICLAATAAPLRFSGLLPRMLQPVIGI